MAALVAGALILTVLVGGFVDVIPRPGWLDPRRGPRLQDQLAGGTQRAVPPRPQPTVTQWTLLAAFFLGNVAIDANRQLLSDIGVIIAVVTLVWLIVLRVRRARRSLPRAERDPAEIARDPDERQPIDNSGAN